MDIYTFGRSRSFARVHASPSRASPSRDHRSSSIESDDACVHERIESNRIARRLESLSSHLYGRTNRTASREGVRVRAHGRLLPRVATCRRDATDHDSIGTDRGAGGFFAIAREGSRDVVRRENSDERTTLSRRVPNLSREIEMRMERSVERATCLSIDGRVCPLCMYCMSHERWIVWWVTAPASPAFPETTTHVRDVDRARARRRGGRLHRLVVASTTSSIVGLDARATRISRGKTLEGWRGRGGEGRARARATTRARVDPVRRTRGVVG